jgi:hypothetical protein
MIANNVYLHILLSSYMSASSPTTHTMKLCSPSIQL